MRHSDKSIQRSDYHLERMAGWPFKETGNPATMLATRIAGEAPKNQQGVSDDCQKR